ncbi:MAG TPA: hypothetical protein VGO62_02260 [Myxococcota bacterium]|jgi:hypothetical protein
MRFAVVVLFALASFACIVGCTLGDNGSNSTCTCDVATQKYDDTTKTCVASASFTAPTGCKDDGTAVCGCDNAGYTSECAAYAVGVEVAYAGACSASHNSGGGGFGW